MEIEKTHQSQEDWEIIQRQSDMINKWLSETTLSFLDWDWDGEELVVFVDESDTEATEEHPTEWWEHSNLAVERYSYEFLKEEIEYFA